MAELIPFEENDDDGQSSEAPSQDTARTPESPVRAVYTNEEVSEVIREALRIADHEGENTVGHEEMLAIARDFGLTERDLEGAAKAISKKRNVQEQTSMIVLWFKIHVLGFAVTEAALRFMYAFK